MSKIDWQHFTDVKKSNPTMKISDIFKNLKTDPKLLAQLQVKVLDNPNKNERIYYDKDYDPTAAGINVARVEFIADDGGYYVIYPPNLCKEAPFDIKNPKNVEEIFTENKWKAFWLGDEDDYPLLNLDWVDDYYEELCPWPHNIYAKMKEAFQNDKN